MGFSNLQIVFAPDRQANALPNNVRVSDALQRGEGPGRQSNIDFFRLRNPSGTMRRLRALRRTAASARERLRRMRALWPLHTSFQCAGIAQWLAMQSRP